MDLTLGPVLSTHRFAVANLVLLFAPFQFMTGVHAWFMFTGKGGSPAEKAIAVVINAMVWGAAVWSFWRILRKRVVCREGGIEFFDGDQHTAMRWDEVVHYGFVVVEASYSGINVSKLVSTFQRARGKRFSGGAANVSCVVSAADGRSLSFNQGFSGVWKLCDTILDHVDLRLAKEALERISAGGRAEFGQVQVSAETVSSEGREYPIATTRFQAIDGRVFAGTDELGGVANAYALVKVIDRLRTLKRAEPSRAEPARAEPASTEPARAGRTSDRDDPIERAEFEREVEHARRTSAVRPSKLVK